MDNYLDAFEWGAGYGDGCGNGAGYGLGADDAANGYGCGYLGTNLFGDGSGDGSSIVIIVAIRRGNGYSYPLQENIRIFING
jgi:hypothetical protein